MAKKKESDGEVDVDLLDLDFLRFHGVGVTHIFYQIFLHCSVKNFSLN